MDLKHCLECKDEFLPKYPTQTYCCKVCSNRVKARAARGKAKKARAKRKCAICGESFKSLERARTNKYCSRECAGKARRKPKLIRNCKLCRKPFESQPSYEKARGRASFCSTECSREYKRQHRSPKLERSYVDNLFSRLVRRRDGACLYCGTTEGLQCAHVLTRSVSILRADLDNAITLCYKHHIHWWHKDPIAAARWFEKKWPGRYDSLIAKRIAAERAGTKVSWREEFDRLKAIEDEWDGKPQRARAFGDRNQCRRGHPLDGDNVLIKKDGQRRCRECHRLGAAARARGMTIEEYNFYECCTQVNGMSDSEFQAMLQLQALEEAA